MTEISPIFHPPCVIIRECIPRRKVGSEKSNSEVMLISYPHSNWALEAVVELDRCAPGVAGHFLRSSPERRQVLAALMAATPAMTYSPVLGNIAQSATHDELIEHGYGSNPSGYRNALAKSGVHVQPRRFYRYLHGLLTAPSRSDVATVVRRMKRVTYPRLLVLRALPDDLRSSDLIDLITDGQQARDLATMVALLAQCGVDRDQMCRAVALSESPAAFRDFARRWVLKAEMPPHPVPASEEYIPVRSGSELAAMSRKYRNCARNYICRILEGVSAMAEFHHPAGSAVIHLEWSDERWRLDEIYGPRNRSPGVSVRESAQDYLRSHGVTSKSPPRSTSPWASLRRIGGHFDFEE